MSEITHLACARCGADNVVDNRSHVEPQQVLTMVFLKSGIKLEGLLSFNCQHCKCVYSLPVIQRGY